LSFVRRTRTATAAAAIVAVLAVVGCGDDPEEDGPTVKPAAGADTPMETPGVPPGSSYDVSGSEWLALDSGERDRAAEDFVADNPSACSGGEDREASAETVRDYADATLGTDYPLNAPVAELLAEGCAASLQSG
jgi:hypothetical protein